MKKTCEKHGEYSLTQIDWPVKRTVLLKSNATSASMLASVSGIYSRTLMTMNVKPDQELRKRCSSLLHTLKQLQPVSIQAT